MSQAWCDFLSLYVKKSIRSLELYLEDGWTRQIISERDKESTQYVEINEYSGSKSLSFAFEANNMEKIKKTHPELVVETTCDNSQMNVPGLGGLPVYRTSVRTSFHTLYFDVTILDEKKVCQLVDYMFQWYPESMYKSDFYDLDINEKISLVKDRLLPSEGNPV